MIKKVKGTKDVLPSESYKWHYIEDIVRNICSNYSYDEIRTPVFESTDLFAKTVGETTDIVSKEMYSFTDKGGENITLRPEGTASVVRSYIENSMHNLAQPVKVYYLTSVYRYERPQKGRLREHHQFGIEAFGSFDASQDAEVISIANELFKRLKIKDLKLYINSIGCSVCREKYNNALKEYYLNKSDNLCSTCNSRLNTNTLRILDCKADCCIDINKTAPRTLDYICNNCKDHHESLQEHLNAMGIKYEIDPSIVRGLDYYTSTVFEFVSTSIGAKSTVCGGGRYNDLVRKNGGADIPAVGFGLGIERLLLLLESQNIDIEDIKKPKVYIASMGKKAEIIASKIHYELVQKNIKSIKDTMSRSIKAQFKYANKQDCDYVVIIGEQEIESQKYVIKNMKKSTEESVSAGKIIEYLEEELDV